MSKPRPIKEFDFSSLSEEQLRGEAPISYDVETLNQPKPLSVDIGPGWDLPARPLSLAPKFEFQPTVEQEQIRKLIHRTSRGSVLISALAGTGKTSTLLWLLPSLSGDICVGAFNVPIARELEHRSKLAGIIPAPGSRLDIGTVHKIGRRMLVDYLAKEFPGTGSIDVRDNESGGNKIKLILDSLWKGVWLSENGPRRGPVQTGKFKYLATSIGGTHLIAKLVEMGKNCGVGLAGGWEWWEVAEHFQIWGWRPPSETVQDQVFDLCDEILEESLRLWEESRVIDIPDMIYLPLKLGLTANYRWVLIDEGQDLSNVRQMFAANLLDPEHGRMIIVSDRNQAIYGFSGADSDALENIVTHIHARVAPGLLGPDAFAAHPIDRMKLSVSWRSTKAIIRWARTWVPDFQAAPDAEEGKPVEEVEESMFWCKATAGEIGTGHAILCRNFAPLIPIAFKLMKNKIACSIEGRDLGAGLISMAKRITRDAKSATLGYLHNKLVEEFDFLLENAAEERGSTCDLTKEEAYAQDQVQALKFVVEIALGQVDREALIDPALFDAIRELFVDTDKNNANSRLGVKLSTVHKAKGKEWPVVWIWGRNRFMPSPRARSDWERAQEENLIYVAGTRAMKELWEVVVE